MTNMVIRTGVKSGTFSPQGMTLGLSPTEDMKYWAGGISMAFSTEWNKMREA